MKSAARVRFPTRSLTVGITVLAGMLLVSSCSSTRRRKAAGKAAGTAVEGVKTGAKTTVEGVGAVGKGVVDTVRGDEEKPGPAE